MYPRWIFLISLSLTSILDLVFTQEVQFLRNAVMDRERRFYVEWGVGFDDDIIFTVEVRTLGYVALGFSRDGTMLNSDMVVGWVSNGQVFLQDRYSERNEMPNLDAIQNWELLAGGENGTHTFLRFRRKLNTCDPQDFVLEYDNTVKLMYAYSFEDPTSPLLVPYHGPNNRGWRSFMLLQPLNQRDPNVEFWDAVTPPFTLNPEWDTYYWCGIKKGPQLSQKHHISVVDARITGGVRGNYVHHILMFECVGATPAEFEPFVNDNGYNCFSPASPSVIRRCDAVMAGWGKGGTGLVLPEHIGFPIETTPKYYMLQVHFDNVNRESGITGQAGIRFHHTPRLRTYDGAYLFVGADSGPTIMIPPGIPDFQVTGHGNPDCYGPGMPPGGVRINSAFLHTHILGSRLKQRHFRGNIELPTMVDNKNYDPEYQQYHQMAEDVLMLPNDHLTFECTYDSRNRSVTTFGGYSTREEMCLSFMVYYPRFEGRGSLGVIPKPAATRIIGSPELATLTAGQPDYDRTFVEFMTRYDWNRTSIRRFESEIRQVPQETLCFRGIGDLTTVRTATSYPSLLQEYFEPPTCPSSASQSFIAGSSELRGRQIQQGQRNRQNLRAQQNVQSQQNVRGQQALRAQQNFQGQQNLRPQTSQSQQTALPQGNAQSQQTFMAQQNSRNRAFLRAQLEMQNQITQSQQNAEGGPSPGGPNAQLLQMLMSQQNAASMAQLQQSMRNQQNAASQQQSQQNLANLLSLLMRLQSQQGGANPAAAQMLAQSQQSQQNLVNQLSMLLRQQSQQANQQNMQPRPQSPPGGGLQLAAQTIGQGRQVVGNQQNMQSSPPSQQGGGAQLAQLLALIQQSQQSMQPRPQVPPGGGLQLAAQTIGQGRQIVGNQQNMQSSPQSPSSQQGAQLAAQLLALSQQSQQNMQSRPQSPPSQQGGGAQLVAQLLAQKLNLLNMVGQQVQQSVQSSQRGQPGQPGQQSGGTQQAVQLLAQSLQSQQNRINSQQLAQLLPQNIRGEYQQNKKISLEMLQNRQSNAGQSRSQGSQGQRGYPIRESQHNPFSGEEDDFMHELGGPDMFRQMGMFSDKNRFRLQN